MPRGFFIVFEGLDRSGKTTQSQLLVQTLQKEGIDCTHMHFPIRTTPSGKRIDAYLKNEIELSDQEIHQLFADNRKESQEHMISTLESGTWIVCDRYAYSGVAYSSAKGMNMEECMRPDEGNIAADLVIYLNVPVEILRKRSGFGDERYEREEFQKQVAAQFDALWQLLPASRVFILKNCTSDAKTVASKIQKDIYLYLLKNYIENSDISLLWH
jgi:dTMP kinase